MLKLTSGLLVFVLGILVLLSAPHNLLQASSLADDVSTCSASNQYYAEYFGNASFNSSSITDQCESAIDYSWGASSPSGLPSDSFSIRWSRKFDLQPGTYYLAAAADSKMLVKVNGTAQTGLDIPFGNSTRNRYAPLEITSAGNYLIEIEFVETTGNAEAYFEFYDPTVCYASGKFFGEYFDDASFGASGLFKPAFTRCDTDVNFDWGNSSPSESGASLTTDSFSTRWSREFNLQPGTYYLAAAADSKMIVKVDGTAQTGLDIPYGSITRNRYAPLEITSAGSYLIEIEFVETTGNAEAFFELIDPNLCYASGKFFGEYFDDASFGASGIFKPAFTRCDTDINFDWGNGSPSENGTSLTTDSFTIRWRAPVSFSNDDHYFISSYNDAVKVSIDGNDIIDTFPAGVDSGATDIVYGNRTLSAGSHNLEIEYAEFAFTANVHVEWFSKPTGNALYVSPLGNDNNPGTLSQPLKTIERARNLARAMISAGMTSDITIYLRGGDYYLSDTIELNWKDSGNNGYKVIYKNYDNETPVLIGGTSITGWTLDSGNIYKTNVGSSTDFFALYENDQRATISRTPNTGYLQVDAVSESPQTKFQYKSSDLPAFSSTDASVYIWSAHDWFVDTKKITSISTSTRTITLGSSTIFSMEAGDRYYVQGAKEFIDQPGEWYLDQSTGDLYYWPQVVPASAIHSQTIIRPTTPTILKVNGDWLNASKLAENIQIEGITFANSDGVDPIEGLGFSGTVNIGGYAQNILFKNNTILNAGQTALSLPFYAQDNIVERNTIINAGFHGILINGFEANDTNFTSPSAANVNKGNIVRHNTIQGVGQVVGHGNGVKIRSSSGNIVENNNISNISRSGVFIHGHNQETLPLICFGQTVTTENWLTCKLEKDNIVRFNDISDFLKDSEDGGGIVLFGAGINNSIYQNHVRDSQSPIVNGFTMGIYNDDTSSSTKIMKNIVSGLSGDRVRPIYVKGNDNQILNNIIANNDADRDIQFWNHTWENKNTILHNNIIYNLSSRAEYMYYFLNWAGLSTVSYSDNNLFYHQNSTCKFGILDLGGRPMGYDASWAHWRNLDISKYEENSTCSVDPDFADASNNNYRLNANSPALSMNICQIDQASIGVLSVGSIVPESTCDPEPLVTTGFQVYVPIIIR